MILDKAAVHATINALMWLAALAFLPWSASGQQGPGTIDSGESGSDRTRLPQQSLVAGGVALVRIDAPADDPPRATVNGVATMVLRQRDHWLAVVGIPLGTAPGKFKSRRRAA